MSSRGRKRLFIGIGVVALLVALYAGAGYLLAPILIRNALVERAAQAGLELRFGALATRAFSLAIEGYDVQLSSRDGRRLAYAGRAVVDVGWPSLWRRAWILDRVALERPVLFSVPSFARDSSSSTSGVPPVIVRDIAVSDGRIRLNGVPELSGFALEAHDLSTLSGHENGFSARAAFAGGGALRSEGRLSVAPLVVSGELELTDVPLAHAWRYLPARAGKAPPGALAGSLRYRYAHGELELTQASLQARLASGGRVALGGELALPPVAGRLELEAQDVPLALAQPFLPGRGALQLAAGTLSGRGELRLGDSPRYTGSATLRDVRVETPQGAGLLGWQSATSKALKLGLSPFAVHANEVLVQALQAHLVISPQGKLNLLQVFSPAKDAPSAMLPAVSVDRLRIDGGKLDFADQSLETPFATNVRALSGAITRISTRSGDPARVQLEGRVGQYGEARVQGAIELQAPSTRTNLALDFRNLALADFTPYAAKFAGYRIRSGRLDAELHYRVREGRLVGANQLLFDKLVLGEKVESASAFNLPLELAVALLTDAQGRIDLAIPVRGDLRDPQFDLGGLFAKALRNTLAGIVSAPFRLLATLVRGKAGARELQAVRFDAGSAKLSAPEEENLAHIAQALAERPRLALAIQGGYDRQADRRALARATLQRELAQRAGYSAAAGAGAPAGIDIRDPKIEHAAERLFLSRGGQAVDLSALRPGEPGYGRRLLDALVANTDVAGTAVEALARERAQAVRTALEKRGVAASRLELRPPEQAQAGDEGVPTLLHARAA